LTREVPLRGQSRRICQRDGRPDEAVVIVDPVGVSPVKRISASALSAPLENEAIVPGWFLANVATLSLDCGVCVVVSSGEEGAGAASAVG
jgi:hypothetical protein